MRKAMPFLVGTIMALGILLSGPSDVLCTDQGPITEKLLKNLTYSHLKLHDGKASQENDVGLGTLEVRLTDSIIGTPNPDGSQDAAVRLINTDGSTAVWIDLYVVQVAGDRLTVMGPFELGDHTGVQFTKIGQGRIDAVLTVYGPNDPHCCPSLKRKDYFRYGPKGIDEYGGVICKPGKRDGGPGRKDEETIEQYSLANLGISTAPRTAPPQSQTSQPDAGKSAGAFNDILAKNHVTTLKNFQAGFDIQGDVSPFGKFRMLIFAPLGRATGKPVRTPLYDNVFLLSQQIGRILRTDKNFIGVKYLSKTQAEIFVIPSSGGPSRIYQCQVHPEQGWRYSDFTLLPNREASADQIRLVMAASTYFDGVATDIAAHATALDGIKDQDNPNVLASEQAGHDWIQASGIEGPASQAPRQAPRASQQNVLRSGAIPPLARGVGPDGQPIF